MLRDRESREKTQLTLKWRETLRWSDVPATMWERPRALLRALVIEAASRRGPAKVVGDEHG